MNGRQPERQETNHLDAESARDLVDDLARRVAVLGAHDAHVIDTVLAAEMAIRRTDAWGPSQCCSWPSDEQIRLLCWTNRRRRLDDT